MMAPKSSQPSRVMSARGSRAIWRSTSLDDRVGERCVGGDEDRLGAAAMLGLGQQIGRDPGGIGRAVGDDQHFGGAGDHVDADGAEDLALGGGHIGIARADDLARPA